MIELCGNFFKGNIKIIYKIYENMLCLILIVIGEMESCDNIVYLLKWVKFF